MSGRTAVLIVAAGRGRRFGAPLPKQYAQLAGKPVLAHTLAGFAAHPDVAHILTVIHPDDADLFDAALACVRAGADKILPPVPGGAERQDSVRIGLEALAPLDPARVLIQDGARPFASPGLITRVIAALDRHPAALPCVPVADTLKRVQPEDAQEMVGATVDRAGLMRAQTPQGFRFAEILAAHRAAAGKALTDDAAVAEEAGLAIAVVPGAEDNLKITTQDDLARGEGLMALRLGDVRIGQGFDVHRFGAPGSASEIMLCGVAVPHDAALIGHSDADAGLHALTDALLGALGEGDIGAHFPPDDPQWKGAPSWRFLAHAAELVASRGGMISSCDVTLICERPKIGPHRERMRRRIAEILAVPVDRISVKATTTEGLGFTGRGEGLAAQAAACVRLPL